MMSSNILKRKVNKLEELARQLEQLGIAIIQSRPIIVVYRSIEEYGNPQDFNLEIMRPEQTVWIEYSWDILSPELKQRQSQVLREYERWYGMSYQLVKDYLAERSNDFSKYYEYQKEKGVAYGVIDLLKFRKPLTTDNSEHVARDFVEVFERQCNILLSIPSVIEIKELGLKKLISADIARTEIEQAELLFDKGFERAAGSIAGVALELHLRTLCDISGLSYTPKDTIDSLAIILYKAEILDITDLKRIQYLASIRNKCSHPNTVSASEVKSLIEEVKKLI